MGPEAILLSVKQNGREGSYRFTCPNCMDDVEKRADRKIVALLVSAGVDLDPGDDILGGGEAGLAESLFDHEEAEGPRMSGPSFNIDDVIEFHFMLEDDAFIADFLARSSEGA
jgi:hypothetical protein